MNFILSKIFNPKVRFSSLEKIILDGVRSRLDDGIVERWDMQIRSINKIQRLPERVEVNFYRMKGREVSFDENISFSNKKKELKIAEVDISISDTNEALAAEVWCVRGFLFSIEYNASPVYFEKLMNVDSRHRIVFEFNIINDLS